MPDAYVDPVIAEIHATRAAMLEAADGDIRLLMQQVVERQRKSKHRIITRPFPHRTEPTVAVERGNEADSDGSSTHAAH
jgi:hypothetical protein